MNFKSPSVHFVSTWYFFSLCIHFSLFVIILTFSELISLFLFRVIFFYVALLDLFCNCVSCHFFSLLSFYIFFAISIPLNLIRSNVNMWHYLILSILFQYMVILHLFMTSLHPFCGRIYLFVVICVYLSSSCISFCPRVPFSHYSLDKCGGRSFD